MRETRGVPPTGVSCRRCPLPPTAAPSVAQRRQEFAGRLAFVTGPEAGGRTAEAVARALCRRPLALGAARRRRFFLVRAAARPPGPVRGPDGPPLRDHDRRPRSDHAVVGTLTFVRHACTAPGQPVVCPLDAALGLPARCSSARWRAWAACGAAAGSYREARALLARVLGRERSVQALAACAAEDAAAVAAVYARPPDPARPPRAAARASRPGPSGRPA